MDTSTNATLTTQVDLHVHTISSGHAFSTVEEIARAAAARGLAGIAITDHGPALPGAPHRYHFMVQHKFLPEYLHGVRIFSGIEANIRNGGSVDLDDTHLARLDVVLAGFHAECGYTGDSVVVNTDTVLEVMANPQVNIISHPGNPEFPVDYRRLVEQALATGTALEINSSSFSKTRHGSAGNCMEIARLCAELGAPVAIGSDAHIACAVGEHGEALAALAQAGVAPQQVVNRTLAATLAFLGKSED